MKKRTIWISSAAAGAALVLGGTAIAFATTDGFTPGEPPETSDDGGHLTGSDLDAASAAALDDDGRSAYEVEVRLDDGDTVEVRLDANFDVIDITGDDDESNGDEESGADD